MNRLPLYLMLVLPVTAMAQDRQGGLTERRPVAASVTSDASPDAPQPGAGIVRSTPLPSLRFLFEQASTSSPQTPVRAQSGRDVVQAPRRPRPEGSMVGYIDSAMVGSQVRIRFDGGFDNTVPDRAEFFYAKCGCYTGLAGVIPGAYDPDASGPGLGVPESLNFQQLYLDAEYAPHYRFSLFVELPVRWLQPQGFKAVPPFPGFSNQAGIGDLRAGVKAALVASEDRALTLQLHAYIPSGNASKGLGTDHGSIEPALLYHQKLAPRASLETQAGIWLPMGGNAGVPTVTSEKFSGKVFFYGIGPSYELYSGSHVRFTPVVELVGWHVQDGFQTQVGGPLLGAAADAGGTNIVNIKFGARTTIDNRSSLYVGYGRALTDAMWYKDIVRFEYRYSF
jgi:hypothetical protein